MLGIEPIDCAPVDVVESPFSPEGGLRWTDEMERKVLPLLKGRAGQVRLRFKLDGKPVSFTALAFSKPGKSGTWQLRVIVLEMGRGVLSASALFRLDGNGLRVGGISGSARSRVFRGFFRSRELLEWGIKDWMAEVDAWAEEGCPSVRKAVKDGTVGGGRMPNKNEPPNPSFSKPIVPQSNSVGQSLVPIIAIVSILLLALVFTRGGYVNLLLAVGAFLGAGRCVLGVIADLFSFRDYNYVPHWKGIGFKLGAAVGLIAFAIMILPQPEAMHNRTGKFCIEARSNRC
jgi:hypothetical protein